MQFDVTILGNNAAIPAYNRHPSAQILNYNGDLFLIDCGEGTQYQMNAFGIKRGKLNHIFISHLHGDHFFGLVALLTSFNLNRREHPLHVYGPLGLEEIIQVHFKHSLTKLSYQLHFQPVFIDEPRVIYEDNSLTVETILLTHRLPTTGFLFKEKKNLRKIITEKIAKYNIPHSNITAIKKGADFVTAEGKKIPNAELTIDPIGPRSYAYCSDTIYTESFAEQIKNVSTLYHETTFTHEHEARATETFHTTTKQAASLAQKVNAGKLLIGHFSARYEDLHPLVNESREVFANSFIAEEGKTFEI